VAAKTSKNIAMRTAMARLPFVKPLETFEFDYQPSIDRKQVQVLASCHFIEHGDNVIVLGPPGVGKTHLAASLGLKAIGNGYRVLFTTAANLIAVLTRAHAAGRLEEKLKVYATPRLLIIDEIGYLPIDRLGANLFFQLISRRYERDPMILTSNQSFSAWGDVFGDRVIATAILDRLLHHAVTLNIRGNSYRLKDKLKAGLIRTNDNEGSQPGGEFRLPWVGKIEMPLTPRGQPDADAVVHQHLQARGALIGEDVGMVRARRAEDAHHARERGIRAGTHVHGLGAQPDGFDPNHRNHSRSQAAQSRAAAAGQTILIVVPARCSSI
jgi:DNA replication protein DnaC